MKKLTYLLLALFAMTAFVACNDDESYADQKKAERSAINKYIADSAVNVISETQFALQGNTTDVSKNEFVLFQSSGIYMQIVRKGCGEPIPNGKTVTVLCRFTEYNLKTDTIQLSNISARVSDVGKLYGVSLQIILGEATEQRNGLTVGERHAKTLAHNLHVDTR